jgi:hypothetical protein
MSHRSIRWAAVFATTVGASALASTPALAVTNGENIFGSGSSLQKVAQGVWDPIWGAIPPPLTMTYSASSSGIGLAEFGDATDGSSPSCGAAGTLNLACDPTADNGATNGFGKPVLDAVVGTDDPPTAAENTSAATAAGGGVRQITIPVTQAPVALLFSLPTGITAGAGSKLNLKTTVVQELWDDTIPATSDGYPMNTWGAVLEAAGWRKVAAAPRTGQFTDAGGATGGDQTITRQVRSKGSGTTYTFKGFLFLTGDANYPLTLAVDDPTWPGTVPVNPDTNTSGGTLVANTAAAPGSTGYANLADAETATSPGFGPTPTTTTAGGTAHQILFAYVQDNFPAPIGQKPQFQAPGTVGGTANIYTGGLINTKGGIGTAGCPIGPHTGVGCWSAPGTFGSWGGTLPADPDVFNDSKGTNAYPIVAGTYDLAWSQYDKAGSNLLAAYNSAHATGTSALSFMEYVTTTGQSDLKKALKWYGALPGTILTKAQAAAKAIKP